MKITKLPLSAFLLVLTAGVLHSQRNEEAPVVLERGANHNLIRSEVEPDEELIAGMEAEERREYLERLEGASYTQLASGLNYEKDGKWVPSVEVFENFEEGVVAQQGQTKVILSHSLNNRFGSVDMLGSDGGRLRSSIYGISYFDRLTGQSVLLAWRQDSQAVLLPPNQVVYLDAFAGDVVADLRYTYEIGGFEQDVILRENPPSPADYGLNPETTTLEVWTEFAEAPVPQQKARILKEAGEQERDLYVEPDLIDSELDFGEIRMAQGKAFALTDGQGEPQEERSREILTAKRWQDMGEEGLFLIEAVDYPDVVNDLSVLPEAQASVDREPAQGREQMMAAMEQEFSRRIASLNVPGWGEALTAVVEPSETLMASAADFTRRPGYVLDYITESGSDSDYVFLGDETYYISAPYTLTGTTTFEGGAVIKYDTDAYITINGSMDFQTDMYRPVTFTSKKDGTIGHYVTTNGASMGDYAAALKLQNSGYYNVEHARFRYATVGVESLSSGISQLRLWNTHLVECEYGMKNEGNYSQFYFLNALVVDCDHLVDGGNNTQNLYFFNLTSDGLDTLTYQLSNLIVAYNSLITNIGTDPTASLFIDVANFIDTGAASDIYQSVGAGNYYLKDGSPHRNDPDALEWADLDVHLDKRTTYPPVMVFDNETLSADAVWYPVAQRDNDGLRDRGYHYPPIDYAFEYLYVANGVTLTVEPGTALAQYGTHGLLPKDGSTILFEGTAESRINFFRFESAQEDPQRWGGGSTSGNTTYFGLIPSGDSATAKTARFAFTDFNLADDSLQYSFSTSIGNTSDMDEFVFNHSRFFNGYHRFRGDTGSIHSVGNNLFFRGYFYGYGNAALSVYNNLYFGTSLYVSQPSGGASWTVVDNVFDDISLSSGFSGTHTVDYNGYANGETSYLKGSLQANDVTDATITYASGVFGDYYQPSSSNAFLNGDDSQTPADVGLYHFTVLNDISKDTGDLDLGFHYVAVDSNGETNDTDGDGIPDYLEDADGDGTHDSPEETNWQTSENGTSSGSGQLQLFTMLE